MGAGGLARAAVAEGPQRAERRRRRRGRLRGDVCGAGRRRGTAREQRGERDGEADRPGEDRVVAARVDGVADGERAAAPRDARPEPLRAVARLAVGLDDAQRERVRERRQPVRGRPCGLKGEEQR